MPEINPNPTHTKRNYMIEINRNLTPLFEESFLFFIIFGKIFFQNIRFSDIVLRAADEMVLEHLETYK